jgi:putative drug exporter of the RND superfamily
VLFDFSIRRSVGRSGSGGAAAHASPPRAPLERWTLLVLRHRRAVAAAWVAVAGIGVYASLLLPSHLVNSFAVPGTESDRAASALARGFGDRPEGTFTVVFPVHHSSSKELQARLRQRLEHGARVLPGGRLGLLRAGGGVVYGELETTLSLQAAKGYTERLRRTLASRDGPTALVTGQPAIQHDLDPQLASDLRRGEALAIPIALLVLAFVLGLSLVLAVPFVFAACTIAGTLGLLYVAARVVAVTPYATNLVQLIGLGLAVDYSLLIVCRYREELGRARTREEAIARTLGSAGRAVVFSGLAVAIGLALLLFVPVPFVRTMGLGGLLIPLVSICAALTLQPVLLSVCGPRAVTGARLQSAAPWARLARTIMRRPLAVLLPTTAVLLAAAVPVLHLRLTPGSLASLPHSNEATRGLVELRDAFGPGALTPTEVVVDSGGNGGARAPDVRAAVERLADRLFHDPEVYVVALGRMQPYVSADGRYARVFAVGRHEFGEPPSRRLVERIRERHVPRAGFPAATSVSVGGAPPQGVDFLSRTYEFFPWLVAIALALTFLLLARAFRSFLLPLKAVFLNLLSVGASYGVLVLAFGEIEGWIPIFLFATLFGLSMDYEVFLVSRMREAWESGRDNVEAVARGLERTGGLITAAALVMAASFGGFVVGSIPGLRELGLGLALAVLIDAALVRALLLPASMAILGRWNWWLPARSSGHAPRGTEAVVDA